MFDNLSSRFESILKKVRGKGRLTEADVDEVLGEIRAALLDADVNVGVVRTVVARIREAAVGAELSQALDPGQQIVKIVSQELTAMLGGETLKISYASKPPTVVLMAGLQGSGKTTSAAKLARWFEACKVNDEIAMIEDIDTIFLRDNYLISRLSKFKNGELLGIGSEVYSEDSSKQGKFPASNLTGEGKIFADLFGYVKGESFENFVEKFNQHPVFDEMENPFNIPIKFSDESLIRALRSRNNFKNISVIPRDLNAHKYWIDRSWWPVNQMILSEHELVNFPRPLYENRKKCEFILKFFYPEGYPWIIRKRTNIFRNQDGKFKKLQKRILRKLSKLIQTLINNLNTLRGN